jgi:hypothetical protein
LEGDKIMSWIEHRSEIDVEIADCYSQIEELEKKIKILEARKRKNSLDTPRKIEFSTIVRGFYCPTCHYGVSCEMQRCKNCGQMLVEPYEFNEKELNK